MHIKESVFIVIFGGGVAVFLPQKTFLEVSFNLKKVLFITKK